MAAVRDANRGDLGRITGIYGDAVEHGTATFEEVAPQSEEIARRMAKISAQGLPWLVAEADGAVAGYAYASRFHDRSAYRFTLENSVYIDPAHHRKGLGRALLSELITRCEVLGSRQMIAAIGDSGNHSSIGLHRTLGFREVGVYRSVGMKFGRWLDVVLMQRSLSESDGSLPL